MSRSLPTIKPSTFLWNITKWALGLPGCYLTRDYGIMLWRSNSFDFLTVSKCVLQGMIAESEKTNYRWNRKTFFIYTLILIWRVSEEFLYVAPLKNPVGKTLSFGQRTGTDFVLAHSTGTRRKSPPPYEVGKTLYMSILGTWGGALQPFTIAVWSAKYPDLYFSTSQW